MLTQSLDSDIYDYGFILNSTALHEAAMSVLVTTIYGRWRGTTTFFGSRIYHQYLICYTFRNFHYPFSFNKIKLDKRGRNSTSFSSHRSVVKKRNVQKALSFLRKTRKSS